MRITINNHPVDISDEYVSIAELLKLRNINPGGTAVAVNNKIVPHNIWETKSLNEGDSVTIISAAFGG